ncbi:C-C chemokine receptor type 4-like [Tachysurus fulvidraco]|uniref:C-C chemokine receptor type 4-like n=1 Tax=Tachysurus fulvidraco TaxID=1234273 RepID=UPI001FED986A|nr:C-C chemokine receptor type 4-like [Tachysurus fulvidraco]
MEINMSADAPDEAEYNITEYNYDYNDYLFNSGSEAVHGHIAIPIILSTVILISLNGNHLVVVISAIYIHLKSLTNFFIPKMALSDLDSLGLPFWGLTFGAAPCKVFIVLLNAGFYSSIMFLVLMSVERYMAIVQPLLGWMKGCGFTLVPIIACVLSFFAALPAIVHSTKSDTEGSAF